jgi:hypothetical protein
MKKRFPSVETLGYYRVSQAALVTQAAFSADSALITDHGDRSLFTQESFPRFWQLCRLNLACDSTLELRMK